ncbi:MAG: hypothetical protein UX13_C0042G0007 [Candidatus Woesebacteria bacterium GW2011_GWB1_45_5]|uniref:Uncharacterized protein n=1 Tax=Candidatus Woesebacteria bacterium GW2011_GWB1_45_5 TaxID=1618581 RepID=A0A0G1MLZ1_9BACT|nr:MAG: hypothetical protein UX13_C0042G0007 [Candidatus Woesebacteria bacterium GW2011_GWB1_45_5]
MLTVHELKYTIPAMPEREIYIFVGENRSKMAREKGWGWQECQRTGVPRLAAKPLWEALFEIKLDPNGQIFFNLWDDGWKISRFVPEILKEMAEDGEVIIGMGRKVQAELRRLNIPHREMAHPAARGKIRATHLYRKHVREVLG